MTDGCHDHKLTATEILPKFGNVSDRVDLLNDADIRVGTEVITTTFGYCPDIHVRLWRSSEVPRATAEVCAHAGMPFRADRERAILLKHELVADWKRALVLDDGVGHHVVQHLMELAVVCHTELREHAVCEWFFTDQAFADRAERC